MILVDTSVGIDHLTHPIPPLASTLLTTETQLRTHDKRLAVVTREFSIAYSPPDGEEG